MGKKKILTEIGEQLALAQPLFAPEGADYTGKRQKHEQKLELLQLPP
jgi:hypothetical protein